MIKSAYQTIKSHDFSLDERRYQFGLREIYTLKNLIDWYYPDSIKKFLQDNTTNNQAQILDIGCADKYLRRPIEEELNSNYVGIDYSDCNIENEKLPFADNTFDMIICLSLIEHISDPTLFMEEIKRVGNSECLIYLLTPNWRFCVRDFFDDPTHVRPYSDKSLSMLLRLSGFRSIKVFPSLRCKPKFYYENPFRFQIANMIPFLNIKNKFLPSVLKGKARGVIAIALNK